MAVSTSWLWHLPVPNLPDKGKWRRPDAGCWSCHAHPRATPGMQDGGLQRQRRQGPAPSLELVPLEGADRIIACGRYDHLS